MSDKTSLSRYKGKEDVSVGIKRKQSGSSVTLSRNVMPMLDDLRAKYPELKIEVVDDAADTILSTLKGVAKTMVEAIFLAMFIISKYELEDDVIDKINMEIEARAKNA